MHDVVTDLGNCETSNQLLTSKDTPDRVSVVSFMRMFRHLTFDVSNLFFGRGKESLPL